MKNFRSLASLLVVGGALTACGAAPDTTAEEDLGTNAAELACGPGKSPIVNPHAEIFHKSHGEWAAAWWRWVYALPATNHPLTDTTGAYCTSGQAGNVFFIGGTFGGDAVRNCTIPKNKPIFFPIVTVIADNGGIPPADQAPNADLIDYVTSGVDAVTAVSLELDGVVLANDTGDLAPYRTFKKFGYVVPDIADNLYRGLFGVDFAGPVYPSFTDGYWIMLKPLSVGTHTLHFTSADPSFALDIAYHITIAP